MKKIPRRLLWQLDILFYLLVSLLLIGGITGWWPALASAGLIMAAYAWTFYQFKCPHCGRNIMPWTAAKARREDVFCPLCGFKIEVT